jgi:putative transposase
MTDDNTEFDFQKALKGIQEGKPFTGKDGVLTSLIKNLTEAALEAEIDTHLGQGSGCQPPQRKKQKDHKILKRKF